MSQCTKRKTVWLSSLVCGPNCQVHVYVSAQLVSYRTSVKLVVCWSVRLEGSLRVTFVVLLSDCGNVLLWHLRFSVVFVDCGRQECFDVVDGWSTVLHREVHEVPMLRTRVEIDFDFTEALQLRGLLQEFQSPNQ